MTRQGCTRRARIRPRHAEPGLFGPKRSRFGCCAKTPPLFENFHFLLPHFSLFPRNALDPLSPQPRKGLEFIIAAVMFLRSSVWVHANPDSDDPPPFALPSLTQIRSQITPIETLSFPLFKSLRKNLRSLTHLDKSNSDRDENQLRSTTSCLGSTSNHSSETKTTSLNLSLIPHHNQKTN